MDLKSKKVKIIVGQFDDDRAREVMCQAFWLNMTAREGYVWFLPRLNPSWYDVDSRKNLSISNALAVSDEAVPCTTQEMIQVLSYPLRMARHTC